MQNARVPSSSKSILRPNKSWLEKKLRRESSQRKYLIDLFDL